MERELRLTKEEKKELRSLIIAARFKVGYDFWNYASPASAWKSFAGWSRDRNHRLGLSILKEWVRGQHCL